ncbi:hypothetical protein LOAG_05769 [Loa loa]|uniref:DNA helicase n=1 Tax=Loa loa TaxID=7209 RepID=A0A1I7VMG4_LOALO|nr:hypothetical protein LOAG_05769 [Loa loa]EFO22720.1 hypothetical protein LOAG_05769 [Loa loa]
MGTVEEKLRQSSVKSGFELRALRWSDNYRGYLELLSQIAETIDITSDMSEVEGEQFMPFF